MATGIDRRLTTILCADVAGYSGLVERDEDGTLLRLRDYRGRLARLVQHHRGRIANTSGDGVLAEFPSAIEAVRAAIDVQRELGTLNEALPAESRMRFRIGINVGDVMVEEGDLFGEGVNVAARLQGLAEPGSILISGPVYDLVRSKLAVAYEFLGPQRVKNITSEIPVYRVRLGGEDRTRQPEPRPPESLPPPGDVGEVRGRATGAGTAALVLGGLGLVTGESWMGILAVIALCLGLSYASMALPLRRGQRLAIHCLLLVVLLAGIDLIASPTTIWFLYPAGPLLAAAALLGTSSRGRK
jgi:adenylate cyclase